MTKRRKCGNIYKSFPRGSGRESREAPEKTKKDFEKNLKKDLTKSKRHDIIVKLSQMKRRVKERIKRAEKVSDKAKSAEEWSVSFAGAEEKSFQKNSKKDLTNCKSCDIMNKLTERESSAANVH